MAIQICNCRNITNIDYVWVVVLWHLCVDNPVVSTRFGNCTKSCWFKLLLLSFFILKVVIVYHIFIFITPSLQVHSVSAMDFVLVYWMIKAPVISLVLFLLSVIWWCTQNWQSVATVSSQNVKSLIDIDLLVDLSNVMSLMVVTCTQEYHLLTSEGINEHESIDEHGAVIDESVKWRPKWCYKYAKQKIWFLSCAYGTSTKYAILCIVSTSSREALI